MKTKLTAKQEMFCQAFIQTGNKSEAYRMSYNCSRMKNESIHRKAVELFENGNITARVEQLQKEVAERNKVTVDELVMALAGMVRFDIAELYDQDGNLKPIHQIPINARLMVTEVETFEEYANAGGERVPIGQTRKVKVVRKLDAIEKLMKHLGGYQKDNAQKSSVFVMTPDERKSRLEELKGKLKGS